jgi:hypothetical protein
LEFCHTPFVARLDSDDIAIATRLEEQRNFLLAHPEVGLVGSQAAPLGDYGFGRSLKVPLEHDALFTGLITGRHAVMHSTVMYRTALVKQIGGYWQLPSGEDFEMFLRLSEITKLANLDRVLLLWRVHERSLTGKAMRQVRFYVSYACDACHRRRAGLPAISVDEYEVLYGARPWWKRALETIDIHARIQYRVALAELYGRHRLRGAARMAWAALCAPQLTIERIGRIMGLRNPPTLARAKSASV